MTDEPQIPQDPAAGDNPPPAPQPQLPPTPQPTGSYQPVYQSPVAVRPTNDSAVASIIVACSSLALLMLTAGLAAPLTIIASAVATFLGHRGKEAVDQGKTTVQRDLAVGGFWTGIGGIVLSILALIAWIVIITLIVVNTDWDAFQDDFHNEFDSGSGWERVEPLD